MNFKLKLVQKYSYLFNFMSSIILLTLFNLDRLFIYYVFRINLHILFAAQFK